MNTSFSESIVLAQSGEEVETLVPRVPVGEWFETVFDWIQTYFTWLFDFFSALMEFLINGLGGLLQAPHALIVIAIFAGISWVVKDWKVAIGSVIGLGYILVVDQWDYAMDTLALVLIATLVALVIGIPVGIAAGRWDSVSRVVRPVMDLMQTMPAFVWLVPAVILFGIGVASGVVATIIFALAPAVRLTELGIRQVDPEIVEAGQAFGGSPGQIMRGIQLPLAMPNIMAGVNQVIMLALSMAVIAGLVGAGGLGGQVTTAISRVDTGLGFEAGLAVVALAIYLDRVTAGIGGGGLGWITRWFRERRRGTSGPAQSTATTDETETAGEMEHQKPMAT